MILLIYEAYCYEGASKNSVHNDRKSHLAISLKYYLLVAFARHIHCPCCKTNRKHYPIKDMVLYDPG
ncbi:hypothetical protein NTGM5_110003 [Candidatus Nitrotoga sp. M5]|nr:hypothetical protein NTGM5_110003 [Candidatus Nitrotoga sp. M5]